MTLRWSVKNEYGGVMTDSCSKGVRGREVSLGDLRLAASATRRPIGDLVAEREGFELPVRTRSAKKQLPLLVPVQRQRPARFQALRREG